MAVKDTASYKTFDQIAGRLDEIVGAVRSKDTSLERSLDLFDEAIELGSRAVEMVDKVDFTEEEAARIAEAGSASAEPGPQPAPEA